MDMNFDDIKKAWDNQSDNEFEVPKSIEVLKKAKHPVERIKRNMKLELCIQVPAVVLIAFFPKLLHISKELYPTFYIVFVAIVAISAYYFYKFYGFYKRIGQTNLSSKDSLYELYYELRLNIEMYKSFSFALTPFALMLIGMSYASNVTIANDIAKEGLNTITMLPFLVGFGVTLFTVAVLTSWWVNKYYGKYGNEIKKLLDELKEE
jgi:uncharacterized membrane protein